jgi:hypothetical protein
VDRFCGPGGNGSSPWYRRTVDAPESIARAAAGLVGIAVVLLAVRSAIRTFVLPRPARDGLLAFVFTNLRKAFNLVAGPTKPYADRDRRLAWFAPIGLLLFPVVVIAVVIAGYSLVFWGLGLEPGAALRESGSSLLTLGFAVAKDLPTTLVAFSEAAIGLILIALLIAYLPTMYADFTRRESEVNLLEVRAGTPASSVYMWELAHRIGAVDRLDGIFERWERWFSELEETHTTLPALVFFRSPRPNQSWVSASAAVLDAAALRASTLDRPRDPQVETCVRAGYLALNAIADFFRIPHPADPRQGDPISIPREEFDGAYARLREAGVPIRPDRDQCWRDFAGWRVNYDAALLGLARLTVAPPTPWVTPGVPHPRMLLETEPVPADRTPGLVRSDGPERYA